MSDLLDRFTTPRMLVALAAGGSAAVLAAALTFQAAGFAPCELCIAQRWPHLVAAVLGGAILLFRLPLRLAAFGAVAALTTGGIGIYHSLVERHLIQGPTACTSSPVGSLSAQDLLAQINAAPLVRCDEIAWQMFGVTMPNLNVVASAVFAALWIAAYLKAYRR